VHFVQARSLRRALRESGKVVDRLGSGPPLVPQAIWLTSIAGICVTGSPITTSQIE